MCYDGIREIQLSYAIGKADPVSISVETFNTGKYDNKKILSIIHKLFDLRPNSINKKFSMTKPSFKYLDLASYGHFGRPDVDCPWERLDKVDAIKELLK